MEPANIQPASIKKRMASLAKSLGDAASGRGDASGWDVEWWTIKAHALFWILAAALVIYLTDFVRVCMESTDVNRGWVTTGLVFIGAALVALVYMATKLPRTGQHDVESDMARFPVLIPLSVVFLLVGFVMECWGFWPVYKGLTPLYLSLYWWSSFMTLHLIPYF